MTSTVPTEGQCNQFTVFFSGWVRSTRLPSGHPWVRSVHLYSWHENLANCNQNIREEKNFNRWVIVEIFGFYAI